MELPNHELKELFDQLGLPSSKAEIEQFVAAHTLPDGTKLADATFWNPAQAEFLRDQINDDADWAELVDQLNVLLHR